MALVKNLSVDIEQSSGFCFGVENAIKLAEGNLEKYSQIYCLGQIVHNEEEINRLKEKGLNITEHSNLDKIKDSKILFRSHGEPPRSFQVAEKNNNQVIDATCPIILKFQKRIQKSFLQDENIYIFGKPEHPEIIGLQGQVNNKAVVFDDISKLDLKSIPSSITLYSQTTMPLNKFKEIVAFLNSNGVIVKVQDTICRQVSNREIRIKKFCSKYDKILFIAGKNSSNGKVLFQICKNVNSKSRFISSVDEIDKKWFDKNDKIGICGATSTPKWLLEKVKNYLLSL
jgi:4-hydroxy-3-methylbut-2-en-1-yl diphosphate reductase